jgi:hypothetical protein
MTTLTLRNYGNNWSTNYRKTSSIDNRLDFVNSVMISRAAELMRCKERR